MSFCRKFTRYCSKGLAGVAITRIVIGLPGGSYTYKDESPGDMVSRGKTRMKVPHIAIGINRNKAILARKTSSTWSGIVMG